MTATNMKMVGVPVDIYERVKSISKATGLKMYSVVGECVNEVESKYREKLSKQPPLANPSTNQSSNQ